MRWLACVGGLAAAFCGAAASAAVVVQSVPFEQLHAVALSKDPYFINDPQTTLLHFDPFDSGLGVLTSVQWTLTSAEDYGSGLSSPGEGLQQVLVSQTESSVTTGGTQLGALLVTAPGGGFVCSAPVGQECFQAAHTLADFNFDLTAADLAAFAAPGGVDAALVSKTFLLAQNVFTGTVTGVLDWTGDLSLTYVYEPAVVTAGVPEPAAWALMLAGFAGVGALLRGRRRRSTAVAVSRP